MVLSCVGLRNLLSRMLHSNVILLNWLHPNCVVLDGVDVSNCCLVGRGGSSGAKFRISLGLPVGAVINCADNTGMP